MRYPGDGRGLGVGGGAYCKRMEKGVSGEQKEASAELVDLIRRMQEQRRYRRGSPRAREARGGIMAGGQAAKKRPD
jgi:hypothetical protein